MSSSVKQVRFASTKSVKHYRPWTPSPTWSDSTLSSDGPVTPPSGSFFTPLPAHNTTRKRTMSYPDISLPTRIHALLALGSPLSISYDIRLLPSTAATTDYQRLSRVHTSESALNPPTPYLTIICPHLPWEVQVIAKNGVYITVADVLNCLYLSLRSNIAPEDYHSLPSDKERRMVTVAYENRYRRLRNDHEYQHEKTQGLKRIDWLAGNVNFHGLSPSKLGPEVWILHTS